MDVIYLEFYTIKKNLLPDLFYMIREIKCEKGVFNGKSLPFHSDHVVFPNIKLSSIQVREAFFFFFTLRFLSDIYGTSWI